MTEPRLPRLKRAAQPPPMMLTERDREIVKVVRAFRLLTRSQIETLLFPPEHGQGHPTKTSRCRLRLKLLYQHGFLQRLAVSVRGSPAQGDLIYCLDHRGADLLAGARGDEPDGWLRAHRLSPFFLEHTLRINDLRIAVTLAAEKLGWKPGDWLDEAALKALKLNVPDPSKPGASLPLQPDGFFVLQVGERRASFFLEIDRATMPTKRFQAKVRAYKALLETGKAIEHFKTRNFRVLTITTGKRRLASLRRAAEQAGADHYFWFSTFEWARAEKVLTEPVWQAVGQDGLHRLIE